MGPQPPGRSCSPSTGSPPKGPWRKHELYCRGEDPPRLEDGGPGAHLLGVSAPPRGVADINGPDDGSKDKIHILLVEDEASVRNVITRLLTKLGYGVSSAENADAAFEYFDGGGEFDLVVTDIVMPGLSGIQMAEVLKERYPSQRFLFISGYSSKEFGAKLDAPPEPFLPKPFTIEELAEAVRGALEV